MLEPGQLVRIKAQRANVERFFNEVGEITEIPTKGLINVALGRVNIAFVPDELEAVLDYEESTS